MIPDLVEIDVESLGLAADFWVHIATKICG